jgi:hypothetical protein
MSGKGLSATMTAARMAGSQRIRRHWHATDCDCGRKSDKGFFVKHVILLWFKQKFVCDCQKFVCDCNDNVRSPPRVARQRDTFACQATMRFALIAHAWFSCPCLVSNSAQTQRGHRLVIGEDKVPPNQSGGMAVELAGFGNILCLLRRHFRGILTARHTARPEYSTGDLVLG